MNIRRVLSMAVLIGVAIVGVPTCLSGCGSSSTTFMHPDYNFGFVERVAVIPFENLSDDRGAGARMSRYFVSELMNAEVFDVVEPGEVTNAMATVGAMRTAELTNQAISDLGKRFRAQALFLGSVTESSSVRSGTTTENVVTIDVRLVETETGAVIWGATLTETGRGFWSGLFGTNGATMGEVSREAASRAVNNLVD